MKELEEALWNVPIKSTQVIKKYIRNNYISKDKIRAKIKKLEKQEIKLENTSEFIISDIIQPKIDILKELLEEN